MRHAPIALAGVIVPCHTTGEGGTRNRTGMSGFSGRRLATRPRPRKAGPASNRPAFASSWLPRIQVAIAAGVLAGCGAEPVPFRPEVPQPEPVEFRPHTAVGVPLAGAYLPSYKPFRYFRCPAANPYGNPYCTGAAGARRSYIWHDGSERGALRVRVTRYTYPMLSSRNDPSFSVRPITGHIGPPPGSPGRKWYVVWRDTLEVQRAEIGEVRWEIAGRWLADSVHLVIDPELPRKVGTTAPASEFPEPFEADGVRYHHPAEDELATYAGTIRRTGLGERSSRYALRCDAEVRPVCSHIDPVVVVTIHGGGVARLTGRWWRPSSAIQAGAEPEGRVDREARPDARGHAIFKHLAPEGDGFTANLPYHPHTRFEGRVAVRCAGGGEALEAAAGPLQRFDSGRLASIGAFAWVFADCDARTVTTMRDRYPDLDGGRDRATLDSPPEQGDEPMTSQDTATAEPVSKKKKRGRPPKHDYDIDKLQRTIPAEPEQLAKVILSTPPRAEP